MGGEVGETRGDRETDGDMKRGRNGKVAWVAEIERPEEREKRGFRE